MNKLTLNSNKSKYLNVHMPNKVVENTHWKSERILFYRTEFIFKFKLE